MAALGVRSAVLPAAARPAGRAQRQATPATTSSAGCSFCPVSGAAATRHRTAIAPATRPPIPDGAPPAGHDLARGDQGYL
jgi:hypothetical protein